MKIEEIGNKQFDIYWRNVIEKKEGNKNKGSRLFELIAERYTGQFNQTGKSLDFEHVCDELWKWYDEKYNSIDTTRKSKQGTKRNVTAGTTVDGNYNFDIPYKETQFKANLRFPTQLTPEAIQHFSVAFGLSAEDCNDVLRENGYMNLSPKYLHELTVYSVLEVAQEIANPLKDEQVNLFVTVKGIYKEICDLISPEQASKIPYNSKTMQSTTFLIEDIYSKLVEAEGNMKKFDDLKEFLTSYIKEQRDSLNWRHNKIISEHKELVTVFQDLFDDRKNGYSWPDSLPKFCLYHFVNEYCLNIDKNHFEVRLIRDIEKDTAIRGGNVEDIEIKHPTREIMIILWLFREIFRNAAPIQCPPKYCKDLNLKYKESDNDTVWFDIHEYLYKSKRGDSPRINTQNKGEILFDGPNIQSIINKNLRDFGYDPLSSTVSIFDSFLMEILNVSIYDTKNGYKYSYSVGKEKYSERLDNHEIADMMTNCDTLNIPFSFCFFHERLKYIKTITIKKTLKTSDVQNIALPSLYEKVRQLSDEKNKIIEIIKLWNMKSKDADEKKSDDIEERFAKLKRIYDQPYDQPLNDILKRISEAFDDYDRIVQDLETAIKEGSFRFGLYSDEYRAYDVLLSELPEKYLEFLHKRLAYIKTRLSIIALMRSDVQNIDLPSLYEKVKQLSEKKDTIIEIIEQWNKKSKDDKKENLEELKSGFDKLTSILEKKPDYYLKVQELETATFEGSFTDDILKRITEACDDYDQIVKDLDAITNACAFKFGYTLNNYAKKVGVEKNSDEYRVYDKLWTLHQSIIQTSKQYLEFFRKRYNHVQHLIRAEKSIKFDDFPSLYKEVKQLVEKRAENSGKRVDDKLTRIFNKDPNNILKRVSKAYDDYYRIVRDLETIIDAGSFQFGYPLKEYAAKVEKDSDEYKSYERLTDLRKSIIHTSKQYLELIDPHILPCVLSQKL